MSSGHQSRTPAAVRIKPRNRSHDVAAALQGDWLELTKALVHILRKDGQLFNIKLWRRGLADLFGKQGILAGGKALYTEFYAEDFHPWQQDTRQLLSAWEAEPQS